MSVDMVRKNITVIDGVEHLTCRDTEVRPLYRYALGLYGPDHSITSGWEYLPRIEDQLRYLREHHDQRSGVTVYKPVLLLQALEDIYDDNGWAYGTIVAYTFNWSSLDLEAFDNGNWVSIALKSSPPATQHLQQRPIHSMVEAQVGECVVCRGLLSAGRDTDPAICKMCFDA